MRPRAPLPDSSSLRLAPSRAPRIRSTGTPNCSAVASTLRPLEQDVPALELAVRIVQDVALVFDAVPPGEPVRQRLSEDALDLGVAPDENAPSPFWRGSRKWAVGRLRGIEGALGAGHVAQHILENVSRHTRQRLVAGKLVEKMPLESSCPAPAPTARWVCEPFSPAAASPLVQEPSRRIRRNAGQCHSGRLRYLCLRSEKCPQVLLAGMHTWLSIRKTPPAPASGIIAS